MTRRWPWLAAAGVGLAVYTSLFALHENPPERHAASRPTPERAVEIVRVQGQAFPLSADWQPALEPTHHVSAPVPEPAEQAREPNRALADSSEVSRPIRPNPRTADDWLDSMQVSGEKAGRQLRPETREPVVVYVPSSPALAMPQGRAPVSPRSVVFGELWATPSVVQAVELRRVPVRNAKVAQLSSPPSAVRSQPSATARTESLEVRGSLSDHTVRRAIERIQPQLNECFAQHGRGSQTPNTVRVELTIDETGRARDPRLQGVTGAWSECLVQALRKLVASAPDTGTVKVVWNLHHPR